jgi:hypothetical protein
MSSGGAMGVQQGAAVNQKHRPNYSNDTGTGRRQMEKESGLEYRVNGAQVARIKIGIRIRAYHQIESLKVLGRAHPVKALTVWPETSWPAGEPVLAPPQSPISQQCDSVYSTTNPDGSPTGDMWFGFVAKYDPSQHGTNGFDTTIVVKNVDLIPANGFETVTIVFTPEGNMFATDHYIVATSVLPGENSTFAHRSVVLNGSGSAKGKKGSTSSKSKAAKGNTTKSKKAKKKKKR